MERSNDDIFALVDGLRARGVSKFAEGTMVIELLPFAPTESLTTKDFSKDFSQEHNRTIPLDDLEVAQMMADAYNDTVRGGEG
jgi:hypothetical protein